MADHSSGSLLWFIHRVSNSFRKILRSKRLFVPAAQNLLNNLVELNILAAQYMSHRSNAEYCESTPRLRAFIISALPTSGSFETVCTEQLGLYLNLHGQMRCCSFLPLLIRQHSTNPRLCCIAVSHALSILWSTRSEKVDEKKRCWLGTLLTASDQCITLHIWSTQYIAICNSKKQSQGDQSYVCIFLE